jgi:hypothetical protein
MLITVVTLFMYHTAAGECSSLTITLLNNYYLNVVEFSPTAAGEFLLTERSNADEEQKIDKSGSKEVLSSKRPLWKRDLAAAWAIMDCNRQYQYILEQERIFDQLVLLFRRNRLRRKDGTQLWEAVPPNHAKVFTRAVN